MKILVDALIIIGVAMAFLGLIAKLSGVCVIAPIVTNPVNHVVMATFMLVLALIIDFKTK